MHVIFVAIIWMVVRVSALTTWLSKDVAMLAVCWHRCRRRHRRHFLVVEICSIIYGVCVKLLYCYYSACFAIAEWLAPSFSSSYSSSSSCSAASAKKCRNVFFLSLCIPFIPKWQTERYGRMYKVCTMEMARGEPMAGAEWEEKQMRFIQFQLIFFAIGTCESFVGYTSTHYGCAVHMESYRAQARSPSTPVQRIIPCNIPFCSLKSNKYFSSSAHSRLHTHNFRILRASGPKRNYFFA